MGLGSPVVASDRTRGNECELEQRRLHSRADFFTVKVLEQSAQRSCGVSSSANFQPPPGSVPAQPDLADPALAGRLNSMISSSAFQPSPCCDSVIPVADLCWLTQRQNVTGGCSYIEDLVVEHCRNYCG